MGRIQGTILFICAAAVGGAISLQIFFDAMPCYLCILERSLIMAIGLTAMMSISLPTKYFGYPILLTQLGLLGYLGYTLREHIGIERGWWFSTCDMNPTFFMSDYIPYIFDVKALCGQNTFLLFGYDMVYWGALTCGLLAILTLMSIKSLITKEQW